MQALLLDTVRGLPKKRHGKVSFIKELMNFLNLQDLSKSGGVWRGCVMECGTEQDLESECVVETVSAVGSQGKGKLALCHFLLWTRGRNCQPGIISQV